MKQATPLAGLAIFNIVVAFMSNWYLMTTIGPGFQTDALFAGVTIPNLLTVILSSSLSNILVPILSNETKDSRDKLAWTFFFGVGLVFAIIVSFLMLTAPLWVPWITPGFSKEGQELTLSLLWIQLPCAMMTGLATVLMATYFSKEEFISGEWRASVAALVGLMFMVWSLPHWGIYAAAWTLLLRVTIHALLLFPVLGKFHPPDWKNQAVKDAWNRLRPILLGTSYYKTDILVDRLLASLVPSGGLSLIHLAQQIYELAQQAVSKSLINPVIPKLSKHAKAKSWADFYKIGLTRSTGIFCFSLFCWCILIVAGEPVLSTVFGFGNFKSGDIHTLWWLLILMGGRFIGRCTAQTFSLLFYSRGNTVTPTWIGSIGYTIGIGLRLVLFYLYGIEGLAIAMGAQSLFNLLLFIVSTQRQKKKDFITTHA